MDGFVCCDNRADVEVLAMSKFLEGGGGEPFLISSYSSKQPLFPHKRFISEPVSY